MMKTKPKKTNVERAGIPTANAEGLIHAPGPGGPGIAAEVERARVALAGVPVPVPVPQPLPRDALGMFELLCSHLAQGAESGKTAAILRAAPVLAPADAVRLVSLLPLERSLADALDTWPRGEDGSPSHVRVSALHRLVAMTIDAFVAQAAALRPSAVRS